MPPGVKFEFQTSPHSCDGETGCGASPGEPCVFRPRPNGAPHIRTGQPRATMHHTRRRGPLVESAHGSEVPAQHVEQPAPVPSDHPEIVPQVIADLTARAVVGKLRYGVALQPWNGRDPARDAYEEAQDLTIYLKQLVIERAAMVAELERLRADNAELRAELEHFRTPK